VLGPGTVATVQDHGLVRRVPVVQILAPVDPHRVSVLESVEPDVISKQEPGLVRLLKVAA